MHSLVSLAKLAVEKYLKEGKVISPSKSLDDNYLKEKKGTFVTLKKNGKLRGCIGTYLATKENIAKEVISNAIAAATEDYRFGKIKESELSKLSFTVYVLSEPKRVQNLEELNPQKYGIIVKTKPISSPQKSNVVFNGHLPSKTGILLPEIEGIDTKEKQIFFASQKGGINPNLDQTLIYKFKVEKFNGKEKKG